MRLRSASRVSRDRLLREFRGTPQHEHRLREELNRSRGERSDNRRLDARAHDRGSFRFNAHYPIQFL